MCDWFLKYYPVLQTTVAVNQSMASHASLFSYISNGLGWDSMYNMYVGTLNGSRLTTQQISHNNMVTNDNIS